MGIGLPPRFRVDPLDANPTSPTSTRIRHRRTACGKGCIKAGYLSKFPFSINGSRLRRWCARIAGYARQHVPQGVVDPGPVHELTVQDLLGRRQEDDATGAKSLWQRVEKIDPAFGKQLL